MKPKIAHLETRSGTPLCLMGLMLEKNGITFSYTSITKAREVADRLNREGHNVKVVKGGCPAVTPQVKAEPEPHEMLACPVCQQPMNVMTKVYREGERRPSERDAYCDNCKMKVTLQTVS